MLSKIRRYAQANYISLFNDPITSAYPSFVPTKSLLFFFWRRFKRDLLLFIYGQLHLKRNNIMLSTKRVLWIATGMLGIGDSLNDLSGRVLFKKSGIMLDLYTDKSSLVDLFSYDDIFTKIFSDPKKIKEETYDFVILQSLSSKCITVKCKYLKKLPYSSIHGYMCIVSFNRTLSSFFAINRLLNLGYNNTEIINKANNYLVPKDVGDKFVSGSNNFIAFGIGGVASFRIYPYWNKIILTLLKENPDLNIILLGSDNGISDAEKILRETNHSAQIKNFVNALSLHETYALLSRAQLYVGVDGGLFHLATAARIPNVTLFAFDMEPDIRLTGACNTIALSASFDSPCSTIPPEEILKAIHSFMANGIKGVEKRYMGIKPPSANTFSG